MTSHFVTLVRKFVRGDDRRRAFEEEKRTLAEATGASPIDSRFAREMAGRRNGRIVPIGTSANDDGLPVSLRVEEIAGNGHALVLGASGAGKTRVLGGIFQGVTLKIALGEEDVGVWVVDMKSETALLARDLIADLLQRLPTRLADALLSRVVVINPFATQALVPLQILRPEPGVAPELQAYEVTTLIDRLGGAELGVRQDGFLYHAVLLGITSGRSLPEVAHLLSDPIALATAASESQHPEVRAYFTGGATRLNAGSLEGVRARLHRLLRLPATRLMLGAASCISFRDLLSQKIVLVDVGSPPLGCEDLGRFWAGLITTKLSRAIFDRPQTRDQAPTAVFVDEWQEGLSAGADAAEQYERLLTMARSRGVSLWLVSQSLAPAARISSSLPRVVSTNTNLQLLFRASVEDARAMTHLLPVTGRRLRPPPSPWERAASSPFLSHAEEMQALVDEVSRLPNRQFYLWNRTQPYPAQLVRAIDVNVERGQSSLDLEQRRLLRDGNLAVPIAELARADNGGAADTPASFRPIGQGSAVFRPITTADTNPPPRRGSRPRRRK